MFYTNVYEFLDLRQSLPHNMPKQGLILIQYTIELTVLYLVDALPVKMDNTESIVTEAEESHYQQQHHMAILLLLCNYDSNFSSFHTSNGFFEYIINMVFNSWRGDWAHIHYVCFDIRDRVATVSSSI